MYKWFAGCVLLFCLWVPSNSLMETSSFCKGLLESNRHEIIDYRQHNLSSFLVDHQKQYYLILNKSTLDKLSLSGRHNNIIGLDIRQEINSTVFPKNYFRSFRKLKSLCLENLQLYKIPNLSKLNELKLISLAHNHIKELIPNLFPDSVQKLKLNYNEIKTIPLNIFERLSNLVGLDISNNKIQEVDEWLFEIMTTVTIDLHDNPINCEENLIVTLNQNTNPNLCSWIRNLTIESDFQNNSEIKSESDSSESDESDSESSEEEDDAKKLKKKSSHTEDDIKMSPIQNANASALMSNSKKTFSPILLYISIGLVASVPLICFTTAVVVVKWERLKKDRNMYTSAFDQSWEFDDLIVKPAEVLTIPNIHINRLNQN